LPQARAGSLINIDHLETFVTLRDRQSLLDIEWPPRKENPRDGPQAAA
jgi:hypothetical protein